MGGDAGSSGGGRRRGALGQRACWAHRRVAAARPSIAADPRRLARPGRTPASRLARAGTRRSHRDSFAPCGIGRRPHTLDLGQRPGHSDRVSELRADCVARPRRLAARAPGPRRSPAVHRRVCRRPADRIGALRDPERMESGAHESRGGARATRARHWRHGGWGRGRAFTGRPPGGDSRRRGYAHQRAERAIVSTAPVVRRRGDPRSPHVLPPCESRNG